jgi:transposase-like protein
MEIGATQAARKLGIAEANIYNWRGKFGSAIASVKPASESVEEENKRLRKKVIELEKANTILKAAAAFFSQDHLK